MNKSLFYTHWLPLLLWMLMIFILSHQVGHETEATSGRLVALLKFLGFSETWIETYHIHYYIRKLAHFTEYLILFLLFFRLISLKQTFRQALLFSWILTVLYAASDEFHQTFVPGRGAAITDVGIDAMGATLGAILTYLFLRINKKFSLKFVRKFAT